MARKIMDEAAVAAVEAARRECTQIIECPNLASVNAVNADDLYKRLQNIPLESDARDVFAPKPSASPPNTCSGPSTSSTLSTLEEPPGASQNHDRAEEYDAYQALIADGGRPAYPIERLEAVLEPENREAHSDLLFQWSHVGIAPGRFYFDLQVFQRQLSRWEQFREWQLRQRNQVDHFSLEKFIEMKRESSKRFRNYFHPNDDDPLEPQRPIQRYIYAQWLMDQRVRKVDRSFIRQGGHKSDEFADYAEAIKNNLSEYGFTGEVEFDIDPKRQSRLATWAEYVDFELRWLAAFEAAALKQPTTIVKTTWGRRNVVPERPKTEAAECLAPALAPGKGSSDTYEIFTAKQRVLAQWAWDQLLMIESEDRLPTETNPEGSGKRSMRVDKMRQGPNLETTASQDTPASQKKTGVSVMIKRLGMSSDADSPSIERAPEWQGTSPPATKSQMGASQRKTESDPPSHSVRPAKVASRALSVIEEDSGVTETINDTKMHSAAASSGQACAPEGQENMPLAANGSVETESRKAGSDPVGPSTDRKLKVKCAASQEPSAAQKSTGISTTVRGLGLESTTGNPKQTNSPKSQVSIPSSAVTLVGTRKRKAKSDDSNNSGDCQRKSKRVATQTISRNTKLSPAPQEGGTISSAGGAAAGRSRATKTRKRKNEYTSQENNGQIPGGRAITQEVHGEDAIQKVNANAAGSNAAETSRKRKRAQTTGEIDEMPTKRLQSLRPIARVRYSEKDLAANAIFG